MNTIHFDDRLNIETEQYLNNDILGWLKGLQTVPLDFFPYLEESLIEDFSLIECPLPNEDKGLILKLVFHLHAYFNKIGKKRVGRKEITTQIKTELIKLLDERELIDDILFPSSDSIIHKVYENFHHSLRNRDTLNGSRAKVVQKAIISQYKKKLSDYEFEVINLFFDRFNKALSNQMLRDGRWFITRECSLHIYDLARAGYDPELEELYVLRPQ